MLPRRPSWKDEGDRSGDRGERARSFGKARQKNALSRRARQPQIIPELRASVLGLEFKEWRTTQCETRTMRKGIALRGRLGFAAGKEQEPSCFSSSSWRPWRVSFSSGDSEPPNPSPEASRAQALPSGCCRQPPALAHRAGLARSSYRRSKSATATPRSPGDPVREAPRSGAPGIRKWLARTRYPKGTGFRSRPQRRGSSSA